VKTRYVYNAQIMRLIDGDSVEIIADCGFGVSLRMKARLYGINTPEMNTQAGKDAKKALASFLTGYSLSDSMWLHTIKTHRQSKKNPMDASGKYGRYLVEILGKDRITKKVVNVNRQLVEWGFAEDYPSV
tara:strand:- start:3246 stop:3635 length:390 start_codon:yes stop_codon:yes gene_type:complete